MFKPNPKAQVVLKFQELFGRATKPIVKGERVRLYTARATGLPEGVYLATLTVAGYHGELARAYSRDWRKAYKLLKLEVEKLYADGRPLP